ncbi:MAG TPA: hypothetical protein ENJ96_03130 [Thermodesulfatator atlanticus]|uniref:Uncharacterized protein n=1 Tax=Thermodesulfatator atlanticus TaxID=501497 RepID=A0A7V5NZ21_9BACT|nr:hypothetical protein [Thermodesulfatator atlanticus]
MSIEFSDKLNQLLQALQKDLPIKFFGLLEIPEAVAWAERGGIAVHENFHTKRHYSYHVISASREKLEEFCAKVNLSPEKIRASDFYRFWHLTWVPFTPPVKKKRPRGRPPKKNP